MQLDSSRFFYVIIYPFEKFQFYIYTYIYTCSQFSYETKRDYVSRLITFSKYGVQNGGIVCIESCLR